LHNNLKKVSSGDKTTDKIASKREAPSTKQHYLVTGLSKLYYG